MSVLCHYPLLSFCVFPGRSLFPLMDETTYLLLCLALWRRRKDRKNFRRSYASPCIWSPKGTRGQGLFIFPGACYARYQAVTLRVPVPLQTHSDRQGHVLPIRAPGGSSAMLHVAPLISLTLASVALAQTYSATYLPTNAPKTTEEGQAGTNQCGTGHDQASMCQNAYLNSLDDW
ncbi:hypothetical protein VTO73DRAFT_10666 [Trametes versicolor]